jgi:hypothetical protein
MRKRNRKRKRERVLQLTGPGGNFGPLSAGARVRARLRPSGPAARKRGRGWRRSAGPPARERGGADGVTRQRRGGEARPGPVGSELRGGSPPSVRFSGGEAVEKHGRVKWVTGVGRIWPAGAYGGRSTAQWRMPAAAKPPVRFPATIGEAKWCPVIVSVWRSFGHSLIEQRKAREGDGSSPEQGREHGGACLNGSGRRAVGMAGVVWRRRGSGGPFYRRSEEGGGWGRRRAPASLP